jgi:hypothetical protein
VSIEAYRTSSAVPGSGKWTTGKEKGVRMNYLINHPDIFFDLLTRLQTQRAAEARAGG